MTASVFAPGAAPPVGAVSEGAGSVGAAVGDVDFGAVEWASLGLSSAWAKPGVDVRRVKKTNGKRRHDSRRKRTHRRALRDVGVCTRAPLNLRANTGVNERTGLAAPHARARWVDDVRGFPRSAFAFVPRGVFLHLFRTAVWQRVRARGMVSPRLYRPLPCFAPGVGAHRSRMDSNLTSPTLMRFKTSEKHKVAAKRRGSAAQGATKRPG